METTTVILSTIIAMLLVRINQLSKLLKKFKFNYTNALMALAEHDPELKKYIESGNIKL